MVEIIIEIRIFCSDYSKYSKQIGDITSIGNITLLIVTNIIMHITNIYACILKAHVTHTQRVPEWIGGSIR